MCRAYLLAVFGVQEDPAKLYHLCRIFGDIDSVLIAGGSDMDNNVSIQIALLALCGSRHIEERLELLRLCCLEDGGWSRFGA